VITILVGDITRLAVGAIVNAANSGLRTGGGVDGAIHRAAGPELAQACRRIGGCPTGEARITPGFQLQARYVIHAVGPVWEGGDAGEPALLQSCYRYSFALALEHDVERLAFPCISTGVYGYPRELAARVALGVMRAHEARMTEIIACCFSNDDAAVYRRLVEG
jgi:O-acetyl-ADP-ribose deacetylase (regulator of RNase III)